MATKKSTTKSTQTQNPSTKETVMSNANTSTPAITTTNIAQASEATAAPAVNPPTVYINPPPANANIPPTDPGFKPPSGNPYRGMRPNKPELVALPDATEELRTFTAYLATFANLVPPQDQVVQIFDAAGQWSRMRNATDAWDKYCRVEEGVVWTTVRTFMGRFLPAFELAMQSDPTLATRLPKLATFLGVKKAIARQGASTKAANKKAEASGQPAYHGAVGKKRKTKAEKAAAAAAAATAQQPPPAGNTTQQAPPAAQAVVSKPDPQQNGVVNGAAHN